MNDEEKPKKKILVLGNYGVGKTSLIFQTSLKKCTESTR